MPYNTGRGDGVPEKHRLAQAPRDPFPGLATFSTRKHLDLGKYAWGEQNYSTKYKSMETKGP